MDSERIIEWLNKTITIELFVKITVLYFLIIWIYLIFWVIKDISERSNSIIFKILSFFIITILSPLGIGLYLLIRPPKTLFEKYNEEIEVKLINLNKILENKKEEIKKQEEKLEKLKQEKNKIKSETIKKKDKIKKEKVNKSKTKKVRK